MPLIEFSAWNPVYKPDANQGTGTYILESDLESPGGELQVVSLNKRYLNKDVYPDGRFQSFADASVNLRRYGTVCFGFYAELIVMFCMHGRFHVTVSPYLGPKFSPLAVQFVGRYSTFMSNVTIEFDFTKLGYGPDPCAAALGPGVTNMGSWVENFVKAQLKRQNFSSLRDLTLLCRRFYGNRLASCVSTPQPHDRGKSFVFVSLHA